MARKKADPPPQTVTEGHLRLPHRVMDSVAFQGASHTARSLLLELGRQLNGRNNGHLQLTESWLTKRGWARNTPARARDELIERGLIVQTRQGGKNFGPSLYAVTWLSINNFVGLDIGPRGFHQGAWVLLDKLDVSGGRGKPAHEPRNTAKESAGGNGHTTYPPSLGVVEVSNIPDFTPSDGVEAVMATPSDGVSLPHGMG